MKKILTSIVVAGLLATSSFGADTKTAKVSKTAVAKAEKKAQNTQLINEAIKALKYTQDALIYLNSSKTSKAKDSLKKAVGELAVVLNSPNAPYLLPVDVQINAYQFVGDLKKIKDLTAQAKVLLKNNQIPQAREILNTLRSEIDINTVNLPLATYPAALNLAIKYINEGKIKEAKDVLNMALSTLVEAESIIPVPLVKAQALVEESGKIIKKDKKEALKYLEEAKHQLNIAQALGYTSTSDTTYKILKQKINNLENEISKGHKTASLFSDLIQKLKEFKQKAVSVIHK
jgi:tetratricopeptide (TPR) repeat protein